MTVRPAVEIERRARAQAQPWPHGASVAIVLACAAVVGTAALLGAFLDDGAVAVRAAAIAAVGGAGLAWLWRRHRRAEAFGAANSVTLVRAALTVLLVALLGTAPTPTLGWLVVGLGSTGVLLDGVDGALARRRNEASSFGARFDMETDALLILVLAALVWQHGKAGPWILAAGLLRYAFVAASSALPWFGAALPSSRRRQAVCVVQIVSLLGALVPLVVPPWSAALALAGLAALVWSFAVDVVWLARHARS
jgi:phosphatidylglycerophosphate synthase